MQHNPEAMARIRAANAESYRAKAESRVARNAQLSPWKSPPAPFSYYHCDGSATDPEQAERMRQNIGYTQPCSSPVRWGVDGLSFCDKHLVQSGR